MTTTDAIIDPFFTKIRDVERTLAKEKGGFALFVLLMPEDAGGKWDVVVSAPWTEENPRALQEVVNGVNAKLTADEVRERIARVITLKLNHPLVTTLNERVRCETGTMNAGDLVIGGHNFGRACLLVSKAPEPRSRARRN
jgi:hypothetical protein